LYVQEVAKERGTNLSYCNGLSFHVNVNDLGFYFNILTTFSRVIGKEKNIIKQVLFSPQFLLCICYVLGK
jgi:hypothetical protein